MLAMLAGALLARGGETVIVIDAGHGGRKDSGSQEERTLSAANNARSAGGLLEKDLTLELAGAVLAEVEKAAKGKVDLRALPTRTEDENPDFGRRAEIAARAGAQYFVSIHFNAVEPGKHKASGTLGLVQQREKNPNYEADAAFARVLAEAVHGVVRRHLPESKLFPVLDDKHLHGGMGSNLFFQLRRQCKTPVTACFLEVEFLDNPAVEKAILGPERRAVFEEIATALAAAIVDHCTAK